MGADGGIGGTYGVMPELFLKMDEYIRAGEAEKATPIQYAVDEIISALCAGYGSMYAIIKEVLKKREGIDIGGVRKPQAGVIPEDQAVIDMQQSSSTRPWKTLSDEQRENIHLPGYWRNLYQTRPSHRNRRDPD